MSQSGLDDLFRRGPMGEIPDGDAQGTAIVDPGTEIERPILWFARWLAWQGKVFYRPQGYLVNKVGPFGFHLIKARVYVAPSWFDNQPAIILDYSKTSLLAHKVQQEIMTRDRFSRLLSPNVAEQVISGKLDIKKGGLRVPVAYAGTQLESTPPPKADA